MAFGKEAADYVEANVHRGSKISFEGELAHNEWLKDGEKRSSLEIALPQGKSKLELLERGRLAGCESGIEPAAS